MIGKKLRNIRINGNLTQKELSERSGISIMTISGLESGRGAVSMITFIQLLRTLQKLELIEQPFLQPEPLSPRLLYKMATKQRKRVKK
ncbi:MAG: helix-turn-helix domain-containing protein [Bacteroidales bacterium]|nr:helix-turn-helix domain-containing protein [Bacteroidales bacterium]